MPFCNRAGMALSRYRVKVRMRLAFDFNTLALEQHNLTRLDLATLTGFNLSVNFNQTFSNHSFCCRAAFAPALNFQQITQFNIRVVFKMEDVHDNAFCKESRAVSRSKKFFTVYQLTWAQSERNIDIPSESGCASMRTLLPRVICGIHLTEFGTP
mgnify:CR=1 FL=1